jgi:hypothetical protein
VIGACVERDRTASVPHSGPQGLAPRLTRHPARTPGAKARRSHPPRLLQGRVRAKLSWARVWFRLPVGSLGTRLYGRYVVGGAVLKTSSVLVAVATSLPVASVTDPSAKATRRPGLTTVPTATRGPLVPCTGRR